jgi:hypothetical protein
MSISFGISILGHELFLACLEALLTSLGIEWLPMPPLPSAPRSQYFMVRNVARADRGAGNSSGGVENFLGGIDAAGLVREVEQHKAGRFVAILYQVTNMKNTCGES